VRELFGMSIFKYKTTLVCSREISFSITNGVLKDVKFDAGCSGSLQGIGKLVEGMAIGEAMVSLKGIRCGTKETSCPDQLTKAIEKYLEENREEKVI
jgi:uncharacterized protein (TIGR03905 family)